MQQEPWFQRKFDFSFEQNIFPSIIERIGGTHVRLKTKVEQIPADLLKLKHNGTWSIQENIGHLIDLEPLWLGRLEDILENKEYLREADLENNKTNLSQHNNKNIFDLLSQFKENRAVILERLNQLDELDVYKTSLHPRLQQPMRVMDLFLFVAEHDDHHLVRISEITNMF